MQKVTPTGEIEPDSGKISRTGHAPPEAPFSGARLQLTGRNRSMVGNVEPTPANCLASLCRSFGLARSGEAGRRWNAWKLLLQVTRAARRGIWAIFF